MKCIGQRLLAARQSKGLSQRKLAAEMGNYTRQLISRIELGLSDASIESLVAAARVLDVSTDYLTGLTDHPTPVAVLVDALAEATSSDALERSADPDPMGHVAMMELPTAAGHGALVDFEEITGQVAFQRSWLTRHGLPVDECVVIRVAGESMEPTLPDGGAILVDRSRRRRRAGRIFVVRTEDGLIVKRLGKSTTGAWQLVSDHPDKTAWPTRPWPAAAEVIGEVKWAARTFA